MLKELLEEKGFTAQSIMELYEMNVDRAVDQLVSDLIVFSEFFQFPLDSEAISKQVLFELKKRGEE